MWVVEVTKSQCGTGFGCRPAATSPARVAAPPGIPGRQSSRRFASWSKFHSRRGWYGYSPEYVLPSFVCAIVVW